MLQTGRVVKLENDPAGEYRILVQVPIKTGKEVWARLSCFDAGLKRGAFFLPEIGDEVLVGFINGDNSQPVILGMLYSKVRPPAYLPKDVNHHRSYTSRSNSEIHLDDDKKIIEIKTSGGLKIVLDEQSNKVEIVDRQSNTIRLGAGEIKIKSTADISIEASSNINLKAGSRISIDANDVEIKARNSLRSTAAQISSAASGNSELRGAVVKIN